MFGIAGVFVSFFPVPGLMFLLGLQAPERLSVVMDDGFNVVQYTFHLQCIDSNITAVSCQVW